MAGNSEQIIASSKIFLLLPGAEKDVNLWVNTEERTRLIFVNLHTAAAVHQHDNFRDSTESEICACPHSNGTFTR